MIHSAQDMSNIRAPQALTVQKIDLHVLKPLVTFYRHRRDLIDMDIIIKIT